MCATLEDEPRFHEMITQWIAEGTLEEFPAFASEPEVKRKKRKRKMEAEAREAEEILRESHQSEYPLVISLSLSLHG